MFPCGKLRIQARKFIGHTCVSAAIHAFSTFIGLGIFIHGGRASPSTDMEVIITNGKLLDIL